MVYGEIFEIREFRGYRDNFWIFDLRNEMYKSLGIGDK